MVDPQLQLFVTIVQLLISLATLVGLLYAGYKFLRRPHETLDGEIKALKTEIETLKLEIKEVKQSLHQGNDKFRAQDEANEVIIRAVMALIRFEIHYCESEHKEMSNSLIQADEDLSAYLSRK